jgi:hypothetical protein
VGKQFLLLYSPIITRNLFKDIIISGNKILTKKDSKNILNYNEHVIYIQCILNIKTKVISVTIEETGTILLPFAKK